MERKRERPRPPKTSLGRDLLVGALAGCVATAAAGRSGRLFALAIGREAKRRERRVRSGSPHEVAGPTFARKVLGRKPREQEERAASALFTAGYGVGWGVLHALVRRRWPRAARYGGLPFALPFFAVCDGVVAPALGLTPTLEKVPWQHDVAELGNHVVWTAAAEGVHRAAARLPR